MNGCGTDALYELLADHMPVADAAEVARDVLTCAALGDDDLEASAKDALGRFSLRHFRFPSDLAMRVAEAVSNRTSGGGHPGPQEPPVIPCPQGVSGADHGGESNGDGRERPAHFNRAPRSA